jgi:hypothetical protein
MKKKKIKIKEKTREEKICHHPRIDFMLTESAMKKIKGGRLEWCPDCGSIRHTDIDGKIGWAQPKLYRNQFRDKEDQIP